VHGPKYSLFFINGEWKKRGDGERKKVSIPEIACPIKKGKANEKKIKKK